MKTNLIKTKSNPPALSVIDLYRESTEKREFVISKQPIKSSTSIGVNIEEALQYKAGKTLFQK